MVASGDDFLFKFLFFSKIYSTVCLLWQFLCLARISQSLARADLQSITYVCTRIANPHEQ